MSIKSHYLLSAVAAGAVVSAVACSSSEKAGPLGASADGGAPSDGDAGTAGDTPILPFQADPPSVYVAKVKNVLVGLPPTGDEIAAVTADPTRLGELVDGWMKLPEYEAKLRVFFELAFQQVQVTPADFADQTPGAFARFANATTRPALQQNLAESIARTATAIAAKGDPFEQMITTRKLMMTPALMQFYSFLDNLQRGDLGKTKDAFAKELAGKTIVIDATGPIPLAQSIDPTSPKFMHWYNPDAAAALARTSPGCVGRALEYRANADDLQQILYGTIPLLNGPNGLCGTVSGSAAAPQMLPSDFTTWKMVTIRRPAAGEKPTPFYDLATLRTTTELVLNVPRVGFFTTPSFFANWQTNDSNQMRGTMNQALIVATGTFVDGTDPTLPATTPGLDAAHAGPGTVCFSCHATLDPLRSALSSTYSWSYNLQDDPAIAAQKGLFSYRGVTQNVSSVYDLATQLATHPLFAEGWAQKLCYYVNSAACVADDPEFRRVVKAFDDAGHSWNTLVRELVTSPLTTNSAPTKSSSVRGEVIGVARRDHLCAALNKRLGLTDICDLDAFVAKPVKKGAIDISVVASSLPSDGYGRGASIPVLPNNPTLFYRAALENMCEGIAAQVIDVAAPAPGVKAWSGAQPDAAIAELVGLVMALTPGDPRTPAVTAVLREHFDAAIAAGASPSDALKSTFTAACMSPTAASIGM